MRLLFSGGFLIVLGTMSGCRPAHSVAESSVTTLVQSTVLEANGKTQPAPGRSAMIAPAVLHPVVQVLVKPGDRVKKDQALVKLDDDEPRADVRAKKANLAEVEAGLARLKAQPREEERAEARALLDSARTHAKLAKQIWEHLSELAKSGSVVDRTYHEAESALLRAEADEKAAVARLAQLLKRPIGLEISEMEAKVAVAKAGVESAEAELEHYTLTAAIDGVVSWLEVTPGTVARPGTTIWGEILDLHEIDVRCDLTAEEADRVSMGQKVEVRADERGATSITGRVVMVGIAADRQSGRVPVCIRLANAESRLRCYVPVRVRFTGESAPTNADR